MTSLTDQAAKKVQDAEEYVRKLEYQKAADCYGEAAALFANAQEPRQSLNCEAMQDFYQSVAHMQTGDYDAARRRAESSHTKFQRLADSLWEAKSRALVLQASTLQLIRFDKFEEMVKLCNEAKGVLEGIRSRYPSEERDLRKEILGYELQVWVEKFHGAVESKAYDSAIDSIRHAIQVNSELLSMADGDERTFCEANAEILAAREALVRGEHRLEEWDIKEAKSDFTEVATHLSSAGKSLGSFKGRVKPPLWDLSEKFVDGTKQLSDGLAAIAEAVGKSITDRRSEAEKDFANAIKNFKAADDSFTQAGRGLDRSAVKARRYAEVAREQSGAIRLSVRRFIIGAGKQAALFSVLMLVILSIISLKVTSLTANQIVYASVFVGGLFGFGLDFIRFKDVLPWAGEKAQKGQ